MKIAGRRLVGGVAVLLLLVGQAHAAKPLINTAWVEAAPQGEWLYHCLVDLSAVADNQPELDLAVQFRMPDTTSEMGTSVRAKGGNKPLLLFPDKWRKADGPADGFWHPKPFRLSAQFFKDNADLSAGKYGIDVIFDLYDPAAKQYVASGFYIRAPFDYALGAEGKGALLALGAAYDFPDRDLSKERLPTVVERSSWPLVRDKLPPDLAAYGLAPLGLWGTLRLRHACEVSRLAFSADGLTLVSEGPQGKLKLWQTSDGALIRLAHGRLVDAPQGTLAALFAPGPGGARTLVDPVANKPLATLTGTPRQIGAARLSPDGKLLWLLGSGELGTWSLNTGARTRNVQLAPQEGQAWPEETRGGAITPDGRLVGVLGAWDKRQTVHVFDAASGKLLFTTHAHTDTGPLLLFTRDGKSLITTEYEWNGFNGVAYYDTATWKRTREIPKTEDVGDLALSPDGALLAVAQRTGEEAVVLLRAPTGELVRRLKTGGEATSVRFTPDGQHLVADTAYGVHVWETATGQPVAERWPTGQTAVSPDGRCAATADREGAIRLWDPVTGKSLVEYPSYFQIALAGEGGAAAVRTVGGTVEYWDLLHNMGTVRFRAWGEFRTKHGPLVLSRNGSRLLLGFYQQQPTVWNLAKGQPIMALRPEATSCYAAAFSPDGRYVATCWSDMAVRVWDLQTGAVVLEQKLGDYLRGPTISPDGRLVAANANYLIWQSDGFKAFEAFPRRPNRDAPLVYRDDGARLFTNGDPPEIIDAKTGELLCALGTEDGHRLQDSVIFTRDGRRIVAVGDGLGLAVFNATTGKKLYHGRGIYGLGEAAFDAAGMRLLTTCERCAIVEWKWTK